jgi:four helix bundle protein
MNSFFQNNYSKWNFYWSKCSRSFSWIFKKDFLHKMSIASKEARETKYWFIFITVSIVKFDESKLKRNTKYCKYFNINCQNTSREIKT